MTGLIKVRQPAWEPLNKTRTNMSVTLPTLNKIVCNWRMWCTLYYRCDWPHLQFGKQQFVATHGIWWRFRVWKYSLHHMQSLMVDKPTVNKHMVSGSAGNWPTVNFHFPLFSPQNVSDSPVDYSIALFDCIAMFKALYRFRAGHIRAW